jgi:hypothetical protein
MSLASIQEIAAIHQIVDPWLRITKYEQARDSGGLYPEGPYSFEADVKVDPDAPLDAERGTAQAAHEVRAHLLDRAEEALEALEEAGWRPYGRIQVEVTSQAIRKLDGQTLHHGVTAVMRFVVDKDRSDEDMAMDPDFMAARILGY